jgi:hypothetical protein
LVIFSNDVSIFFWSWLENVYTFIYIYTLALNLPELEMNNLYHQYWARPAYPSVRSDQALYVQVTYFKFSFIFPKLIRQLQKIETGKVHTESLRLMIYAICFVSDRNIHPEGTHPGVCSWGTDILIELQTYVRYFFLYILPYSIRF